MALRCILIDDEPLARMLLRELLSEFDDIEIVAECANGFEGLKSIQEHRPDLIFLDVQMPKVNGFEMLELLEDPPAVVFVTAFDEYAVQAFEVNAIDYLVKPIEPSRLAKTLDKLKQSNRSGQVSVKQPTQQILLPEQSQRIVVKENGEIKIIPLEQVLYLEAADDYVKVNTKDKYYLKYQTMAKFEAQLPARIFIRIHRSIIVNVNAILKIELLEKEQYVAVLHTGAHLGISKSGYVKLKAHLGI